MNTGEPDSDTSESEQSRTRGLVAFKPGAEWRGNRAGRPKGSRNKLSEAFLADLQDVWTEHGPRILLVAAQRDPVSFVRMVASLIPHNFQLEHDEPDSFVKLLREACERRERQKQMAPLGQAD